MRYIVVKRVVLVILLAILAFGFGYLYFGAKLASIASGGKEKGAPPAPVMEAIKGLNDRIAANPNDEEAYVELANFYFQANKFDGAANYYEKAVAIRPDDIAAENNLALAYHLLKKETKAIAVLNDAIKRSPSSQHLWLTLGLVDYESGKKAAAQKALKEAYRLNPKSDAGIEAKSMLGGKIW